MSLSPAQKIRSSALSAFSAVNLLVLAACGSDAPSGPSGGAGNTWASLALMIEPRQEVGVAVVGNRIFVAALGHLMAIRSANENHLPVHIDVGLTQREQLALAQPGINRGCEERPVFIRQRSQHPRYLMDP